MKKLQNLTAIIAVFALITALLCGCASDAPQTNGTDVPDTAGITFDTTETDFGTGATVFTIEVTNVEGETKSFQVHTDETIVGKALINAGLIAGEDSDYGLYVKTVMGITLDYDTDGKYWAFYVDGEYAATGVDQTELNAASTYAFRAE